MRSPRLLLFSALVLVLACGSDSSGPETPPAVVSVTVTPATLALEAGDTQQLQATLTDADGNTLTGRTVTWASSDETVATVDASGLATAVGKGTATLTAASEGRSGSATATVEWADFQPTSATTVDGDATYATVEVPEGVTVTVAADATITSEGVVDIQGTVTAACHALTLSGASVTITGDISNACAEDPDGDGPGLTIVSAGAITLESGSTESSGDVLITNNPDLTDDDFQALMAAGAPPVAAVAAAGSCTVRDEAFTPTPAKRIPRTDATTAASDGRDGFTWTLRCDGDIHLGRGVVVEGQDAGDGGNAENTDPADPESQAEGGHGGDGGEVKIQSTGTITFGEADGSATVRILLADGGSGGDASMTANVPGGDARASAGSGGMSGTMRIEALGAIRIMPDNGLEIVVGRGGDGGDATAVAADGADAGADAAQPGGFAEAMAGAGGSTPDAQLRAQGEVEGTQFLTMTGGDGGNGGWATATAGNGGSGNEAHPNGAGGGNMTAEGGNGGHAQARDLGGAVVGDGGDAGGASVSRGVGGDGWNGCSVDPAKAGGDGGLGGSGKGGPGEPGTGSNGGADAIIGIADGTGNGGNGGDGEGPGTGGDGGTDQTRPLRIGNFLATFLDGKNGEHCETFTLDDSGLPDSFTHQVGVTPCPQTVGTVVLTNNTSGETVEYVAETAAPLGFAGDGTSVSGSLAPGASVEITVVFDCSQTSSFTEDVVVSVTTSGGTTSQTYTITGTVNP